jgi:hypothetical protein
MSLLFERFPNVAQAEAFILAVAELEPELEAAYYLSPDGSHAIDPFPYLLEPPIVHIERPSQADDHDILRVRELGGDDTLKTGAEREQAIEELVAAYGGRFAGT